MLPQQPRLRPAPRMFRSGTACRSPATSPAPCAAPGLHPRPRRRQSSRCSCSSPTIPPGPGRRGASLSRRAGLPLSAPTAPTEHASMPARIVTLCPEIAVLGGFVLSHRIKYSPRDKSDGRDRASRDDPRSGEGGGPLEVLAADGRRVPPRRSPRCIASNCCTAPRAGRSPSGDCATSARSHQRPIRRTSSTSATPGTSARLRCAPRLRHGLSVRTGPRGLPGARHHRHARRADLPVPADRDAVPAGPAAADGAAEARAATVARVVPIIDLDLSKYDKLASRFQRQRSRRPVACSREGSRRAIARFNELIARIEQVAVRVARADAAHRADGAGKTRLARRIYELKKLRQRVAGPVRRGQLRDDSRRRRDVRAVRPRPRRVHRRRARPRRAAAHGGRRRAVPRRDRRAGSRRTGGAASGYRREMFLPLGSDREVRSDFQLIAGTNADLRPRCGGGRFREDLLARINLWTFRCPGLRERPEDIEPNSITSSPRRRRRAAPARHQPRGPRAVSRSPRRPRPLVRQLPRLHRRVTRMSTLAPGGRITEEVVDEEIERLRAAGAPPRRRAMACSRGAGAGARRRATRSIRSIGCSWPRCCASVSASSAVRCRPAPVQGSRSRKAAAERCRPPAQVLARFGWSGKP